jgi:paraquat-inducible protein A
MTADANIACLTCGQIHLNIPAPPGSRRACVRCRRGLDAWWLQNKTAAWVFAILALATFFPGLFLPILRVESVLLGDKAPSLAQSFFLFWQDGDFVLAIIVGFFSVILPAFKLLLIFLLMASHRGRWRAHVHSAIELIARWGLLDVMVIGINVAAFKDVPFTELHLGAGAYFFIACVFFNALAGWALHTHDIWDETP